MDASTVCPICLQVDAINNGYCRFCKKRIRLNIPVGVLPPGIVLNGRYLTGIFLGSGGFGTIYKALDLATGQIVAVKEYFPSMWCTRQSGISRLTITSPEEYEYGLKHFMGEVEILRSLQSVPEVVRLFGEFRENNTGYYVMEFLEGETLQSYLKKHREKLGFSATVFLLMPIILGMKKVHEKGTTHRDISPDNIFLCSDGSVRIIDFGAAASRNSYLSRSFIPVEKEGYTPPEQHTVSTRGDTQGNWSDVYAMAGTIYRCVIGRRPPSSSQRQAGDELEFDNSGLTQPQINTLRRNLSLVAAERCQSMLSFAKEIVSCLRESEASQLRAAYPILTTSSTESRNTTDPLPPPPPPPGKPPQSRRIAAYALDMFFFQAVPFALGQLIGGPVSAWLFGGLVLGALVTWLMTTSQAQGGPGEVLCGLEVTQNGKKPDSRGALLYCLLRILWPLKIAETLYNLITKKMLFSELSGCSSHIRGMQTRKKQLLLQILDGFYEGSTIPITFGRTVFGRNPEQCNIVFPMVYNVVSRVQFELLVDAAGIFVINRSSHGTWLDGRLLAKDEQRKAAVGSVIEFGNEKMTIITD